MNDEVSFWKLNAPEMDNHPAWVYMDDVFSNEECDEIISQGRLLGLSKGEVYNKDNTSQLDREAMVSWFNPNEETFWMYKRLSIVANQLNNDYYQFSLDGFAEGMQFTEYYAPSGKHGMHLDKAPKGVVRKMSLIVQLSNPDDYENGDLEVMAEFSNPSIVPRKRGTLIMFPSWTFHRVTSITNGTRNSLVAWLTGSPFR